MAIIIQGKEQFYKDLAAFLERQIQSEIETISHYNNLIQEIESSTFWSDEEKARMIAAAQAVALAAQKRLEKQRETLAQIKGGTQTGAEGEEEKPPLGSEPIVPPPTQGGGSTSTDTGTAKKDDSWIVVALGVVAFVVILLVLRQ